MIASLLRYLSQSPTVITPMVDGVVATQDPPGRVMGPDFWETARAVAPIVGAAVTMATFYLRSVIRTENAKQKEAMMTEIRTLFALKETIDLRFIEVARRLDALEPVRK